MSWFTISYRAISDRKTRNVSFVYNSMKHKDPNGYTGCEKAATAHFREKYGQGWEMVDCVIEPHMPKAKPFRRNSRSGWATQRQLHSQRPW